MGYDKVEDCLDEAAINVTELQPLLSLRGAKRRGNLPVQVFGLKSAKIHE